jgi:predicted ATPase/class 3 adenylate cyclase
MNADGNAQRSELPSGTVTFLFTDLEGSTRLWEAHGESMARALTRHDEILRDAIRTHQGRVVKTTGDGVHAVFVVPSSAVLAARDAQCALQRERWAASTPLRVRMGVHTCQADLRDGDYYGSAVNRAARIMSLAHGGQVVVSLATEELLREALPQDVSLIDLGEHRLRDLSHVERIFQLCAGDLISDFPPLRSLDASPGNLPRQLTSFIGRVDELVELGKLMHASRMVTLTGPGGVGKTRLSVQLAAELLHGFPDGAWFFDLSAVSDADSLVQIVATTLSVPPRPGVSLQAAVVELLRSKRALVVVDNCEHLVEAAGRLVEEMLAGCEHLCVLATSREALGIPGEHVWPLPSMAVPADAASAEVVSQSDAGRLFLERGDAARPGFTIDATNARAVAEICRRLDGIPLAIELAAARLVAMTPTEIAGLLDERFRLLTGGGRAAVERHRTLRATVEWSYALLQPVERLVFDRLGVFVGGFDSTAAAAVVAAEDLEVWDVIDALTSLASKSMLVVERGTADTTRYQSLETLREHALDRLALSGEVDEFRRRHAEYYATFAEQAGSALVGRDELAWRPRLGAERDNLRAAVYWALDQSDEAVALLGIRIVAALAYEAVMDPPGGIGAWAERALDVAVPSSAPERMAVLGAAAYEAGNRAEDALVLSRAAAALAFGVNTDAVAPGLVWFAANQAVAQRGDQREAMRREMEGADHLERLSIDPFGVALLRAGASYYGGEAGEHRIAVEQAERALETARRIENPSVILSGLFNLAHATQDSDPAGALALFEEAIEVSKAGATQLIMGPALAGVARLRSRTQDRIGALSSLLEAIEYSSRVGFRPLVVEVLGPGAEILLRDGQHESAIVLAGSLLEGALAAVLVTSERNAALERALATVRRDMDEAQFTRLYTEGTAMSYDGVVDFALHRVADVLATAR